MIKKLISLFKILNSNSRPGEVANAVCLGVLLGFVPKNNLLWYLLFVFFSFVRINKTAYFLITLLMSFIAPALDGFFDNLGYTILTTQALTQVFSTLIDIPFVGFTKFNNTIVCGALAFSLIIYIPLFIGIVLFIKLWRTKITVLWNNSKICQFFYKLPLINKFREASLELM
ncbi:MAG: TIGR03546 family protein [Treponema sp.]|nr:TIGR03546 family protein [Treponema sp.]